MKDANYLRKSDAWKIQLKVAINFISSKDISVDCVMHSRSDNIENMVYDKSDEVIKEVFESLLNRYNRYNIRLQTSMIVCDFNFDCENLLHYKCHKINLKHRK